MKKTSMVFALLLAGCAAGPSDDEISARALQSMCSAAVGGPSKEVAAKLEKLNMASLKYPADGKLLGDWRQGERIAQTGTGMQYSDDPKLPSGANCYACHQLSKAEISFGTMRWNCWR